MTHHELEPFPNKDLLEIKPKFRERYEKLTDFDTYMEYSLAFPRKAIRVNTLKISPEELKERLPSAWNITPVPWCPEGFWIKHSEGRRDIGNLIEHALGYIYVQEASSMIPPIVLDPQPGEIILDMCSAPGSKTTQIAARMQNKGLLFANDIEGVRLAPLGINLQRMGVTNTVITLMYGQHYKRSNIVFDRILVDAPCSGTGTICKSPGTLRMWNPAMVTRIAGTQKKLIDAGFSKLKSGGTLVYSTCSNEPEENEGVINWLLENHPDAYLEKIDILAKSSPPILEFNGTSYNPEIAKCLRIWPQDNHTEGFFVAKVRKK
ncbi:MAG: NOL1/NOP2/sun family putative RNA methylase [Candidatus Woesearchaeota archaeon]